MTPYIQDLIETRIRDAIPEFAGDTWGGEKALVVVDELRLKPANGVRNGWRLQAELNGEISVLLYCDRSVYISPLSLISSCADELLTFSFPSDAIPGDVGLSGELRPLRWRERLTETSRQVALGFECVNLLMAIKEE